MLDDSNGSDPAAMVEKVKGVIAEESRKSHSAAPKYRSEQQAGATIWTLDDETEKALRTQSGLEKPTADAANPFAAGAGNGLNSKPTGTNIAVAPSGGHAGGAETPTIAKPEQKLLIFAVIGKSVIIASSRSLIDRAIASYNTGKGSLASDPAYLPMLKQITPNSQFVLLLGLPDIMEHLRHELTESMSSPGDPKPEDVIKLFGAQGNGLVMSQSCADNRATGIFFIPLDYDRAIHIISSQKSARKDAAL
jgi:hypothetical protein